MEMKYIWIIISAIFIVGELISVSFFLIWIGIGAAAAAILAFLGFSAVYQWVTFVLLSLILFLASRKFADRVSVKQPPGIGADRFIHKHGIVLEEISLAKDTGLVRVEKDQWRAITKKDEVLPAGTRIKVVAIEGTSLVVEKIM